ncbi:methyltransferase domain-containing protein [Candidatus Kaiserbacteria bacterium]|nr:methyltransferase domain-containing protein [Candidatus Kaiserbacteria bacterium]
MRRKDTSWGGIADWYQEHLEGDDTYHAQVIAPNLMRILGPKAGMRVLDLGCGEGYFARLIHKSGARVVGADIARPLIEAAKRQSLDIEYHVASAENLAFSKDAHFDAIICVLALQNMEKLDVVLKECARVLKQQGRAIFVLNHPAFRIPKRSSWGWDEEGNVQYRRIDGYLSASRAEIDMAPGKGTGEKTWSFHRSLQDHMKAFANAGFVISRLEEWISHKKSERGPRSAAEDIARKEFPLFLCVEFLK